MNKHSVFYFILLFSADSLTMDFDYEQIDFPNYDYNGKTEEKIDLREKFLERRRQNRITKARMDMLSKSDNKEIIYLDDIPHYRVEEKFKFWPDIIKMEKDFRDLITMTGVKYSYLRDMHWRTWREVTYPNKSTNIVCYRCENIVNVTCKTCNSGGFWVIDDQAPCPYEILSMRNKNQVCVINYARLNKNITNDCPELIDLYELGKCDNPIETTYQITRDFKRVPQRSKTVMCVEKDFCDISTSYAIFPDFIVFRIINASNAVTYSKIMKNGANYACIDDCGYLDPVTKIISNNEKPYSVDLLENSNKNKREDYPKHNLMDNENKENLDNFDKKRKKSVLHLRKIYDLVYDNFELPVTKAGTTISTCQKLQQKVRDTEEEN